jgi:import inner membrane translocase subunit TIM16
MAPPLVALLVRVAAVVLPVLVKSFAEAYKQAAARAPPINVAGGAMGKMGASSIAPMSKNEANAILGFEKNDKDVSSEEVKEAFERMYKLNDPDNGGSFYIQSKIYRAREYIENEMLKEGKLSREQFATMRSSMEKYITIVNQKNQTQSSQ